MKPQAKMTKWLRGMEYHADLHSTQLSRKHEGFCYHKGIRYTRTTKMATKETMILKTNLLRLACQETLAHHYNNADLALKAFNKMP